MKRTPVKKVRSKPRRGQPTKEEKFLIRSRVYTECGGLCQLRKATECRRGVLPFEGGVFERAHLVHIKGKRIHGWNRENLTLGCWWCHLVVLHGYGKSGQKPCPKKPRIFMERGPLDNTV